MAEHNSRIVRVRHEFTALIVSVVAVEDVTPGYRRITFGGDSLSGLVSPSPTDHVRVLVPLDTAHAPTLPFGYGNGMTFPDGAPAQTMRNYTLRRIDAKRNELHIDFVLHQGGPVTGWARQSRLGQQVGILGPRGSKVVQSLYDWYLMIGDETMLPAILRQIEELPAGVRLIAFIEIDEPGLETLVEPAERYEVNWIYRNGAAPGTGPELLNAIRNAALPDGDGYIFAGGEAGALKPIRRHVLHERGLSKGSMSMSGHWKRGEANHDHHTPIDPDDKLSPG